MAWRVLPLGEVCDILDSLRKPITKRDREAGPYPYYGATGILDHVEGYLFDEKLVLVGEDGAKWGSGENSAFIAEGRYWVNNHAHVLRPHRQVVLDEWLVYFLNHSDLMPFVTGLTVPKLNQAQLRSIPVLVPPLSEQRRIVAILDEAFEGIRIATANAEKNLANAGQLFVTQRDIEFENGSSTWSKKKFGDVCGFVRGPFGGSLKKDSFVETGFAVYEQQHAIYDEFDHVRYFIDDRKFAEMQRFELLPGDLIMSCSGTMGKVAIAPEGIARGVINQALLKLTPRAGLNPRFLRRWMESADFQDQISLHSKGAAIKNIASVAVLKEIDVPLPSSAEQNALIERLDAAEVQSVTLGEGYDVRAEALVALKQSILSRAFSGQLTATKGLAA